MLNNEDWESYETNSKVKIKSVKEIVEDKKLHKKMIPTKTETSQHLSKQQGRED